MAHEPIGAEVRRLVAARARGLCEYCLIHELDTFFGCEIDHIVSRKHGGTANPENLAYACMFCNRYKGTDLGSRLENRIELIRLFNPRSDWWSEHFAIIGAEIVPRTDIGSVTCTILRMNDTERLLEREALRNAGMYPREEALALLKSR
ncbi:MAG: HNH endonuclease [Planctomycetota bacterium]|nr:HNH endonuclease [Planctomycetota bacterium]